METMSWLSTQSLSLGFGDRMLVRELNIELGPGLNVLLGRNGTGKTTLIRSFSGWINPQKGRVLIQGKPIETIDSKSLARLLAVVRTRKDRPAFFPVYDFLMMGRYPHKANFAKQSEADEEIVDQIASQLSINHLLGKQLDQLSDGEYQKVAIAQSLIQDTPILLLDEPTSHLDVVHRIEVFQLLRSLGRSERCLLIATHELELALEMADHIILLDGHGAYTQGDPKTVKASGVLERLFASDRLVFDPVQGRFTTK